MPTPVTPARRGCASTVVIGSWLQMDGSLTWHGLPRAYERRSRGMALLLAVTPPHRIRIGHVHANCLRGSLLDERVEVLELQGRNHIALAVCVFRGRAQR